MGDPYDHAAQYRQLLFVQAFGLTMKVQALAWFQTGKPSIVYNFEVLVKHSNDSYSKIGIKHNMVTEILGFK